GRGREAAGRLARWLARWECARSPPHRLGRNCRAALPGRPSGERKGSRVLPSDRSALAAAREAAKLAEAKLAARWDRLTPCSRYARSFASRNTCRSKRNAGRPGTPPRWLRRAPSENARRGARAARSDARCGRRDSELLDGRPALAAEREFRPGRHKAARW